MPEPDELNAIAIAIETIGDGDAAVETPSRWRLASRDFDDVDFEFDRRRSGR
jgi:hypothetical protein